MNVFDIQGSVMLLIVLALLILKGFAFANALMFSSEAYEAAGKLTKPAWLALTGLGLAAALIQFGSLGILSLVFTVAALVYIADVRPALLEVTSRR